MTNYYLFNTLIYNKNYNILYLSKIFYPNSVDLNRINLIEIIFFPDINRYKRIPSNSIIVIYARRLRTAV